MANKAPEQLFKVSNDALLQGSQALEGLRTAVIADVASARGLRVDAKSAGTLAKLAQEIGAEIIEQRIQPITLAARKGDMSKVASAVETDAWALGRTDLLDFDKIPGHTKAAMALSILNGYAAEPAAQAAAK